MVLVYFPMDMTVQHLAYFDLFGTAYNFWPSFLSSCLSATSIRTIVLMISYDVFLDDCHVMCALYILSCNWWSITTWFPQYKHEFSILSSYLHLTYGLNCSFTLLGQPFYMYWITFAIIGSHLEYCLISFAVTGEWISSVRYM